MLAIERARRLRLPLLPAFGGAFGGGKSGADSPSVLMGAAGARTSESGESGTSGSSVLGLSGPSVALADKPVFRKFKKWRR